MTNASWTSMDYWDFMILSDLKFLPPLQSVSEPVSGSSSSPETID